ncbi:hypothetical protein BDQ12DRAFT_651384 [Crucibulum laeve]|uniref:DyP dimeric alpha+beta barrel domain-containing protein n=1 Tax=Crucibulum laeve TaxID=68775 RepID=A0A5C3LZU2_9AGAR|nr:hypothetical protein BDQ12DRAFT_651384 [Crucibulum laeve]
MSTSPTDNLDLSNIQGDILSGLPKKTQYYLFFQITDGTKFKKDLTKLIPLVKTVAQVLKDRETIKDHKEKGHKGLVPMVGVNIAFSHSGFTQLNENDPFITGQKVDAVTHLGDTKNSSLGPDWEPAFLQDIHGLIIISGEGHASIDKKKQEIEGIFNVDTPQASIKEVTTIRGDVRPCTESGHEHFGFLDGISNPTIIGFDDANANPGPKPIKPGFILTGRDGDADKPKRETAPWTVDGSFLAFRYLFQKVPEFNDFLKKNPISKDGLSPEEGSELLGARLVGRWKSGAPIDITPFKDDPALAADSKRNNDFHFTGESNDQTKCPFAAHIRKTLPRDDLEVTRHTDISNRRIIRRGIQFGPEVTKEEKDSAKTMHGRGLLFACYSSSIANGFRFIQESWADAQSFPPGTTTTPGLDPLIGQGEREMTGTDPSNLTKSITLPEFIVPRGGEYFFSPSLKGLKETLAVAN